VTSDLVGAWVAVGRDVAVGADVSVGAREVGVAARACGVAVGARVGGEVGRDVGVAVDSAPPPQATITRVSTTRNVIDQGNMRL